MTIVACECGRGAAWVDLRDGRRVCVACAIEAHDLEHDPPLPTKETHPHLWCATPGCDGIPQSARIEGVGVICERCWLKRKDAARTSVLSNSGLITHIILPT